MISQAEANTARLPRTISLVRRGRSAPGIRTQLDPRNVA
jgi:hypothetical protein